MRTSGAVVPFEIEPLSPPATTVPELMMVCPGPAAVVLSLHAPGPKIESTPAPVFVSTRSITGLVEPRTIAPANELAGSNRVWLLQTNPLGERQSTWMVL